MWNPFRERRRRKRYGPTSTAAEAGNFLLVTYDSCRYDAYVEAKTPVLDAHVTPRKAYSQATFTFPSHAAMFQGLLPHVFDDSEYYNRFVKQMWRVQHRERAAARVNMPPGTQSVIDGFNKMGYFTCGTGSVGWFKGNHTLLEFWQAFEWTGIAGRRQVKWIKQQLSDNIDKPFFAFINFGETHAPYKYDQDTGLEGDAVARKRHKAGKMRDKEEGETVFDETMWRMQVACVEFLDERMGELLAYFDETGRDVTIVMCGDHGECFGEEGMYGHGFYHPKVMEVPMAIFEYKAKKK